MWNSNDDADEVGCPEDTPAAERHGHHQSRMREKQMAGGIPSAQEGLLRTPGEEDGFFGFTKKPDVLSAPAGDFFGFFPKPSAPATK